MLQKNRLCGKLKSQTRTVYIIITLDTIIEYQIKCFCYLRRRDENRLINYLTMYCILEVAEEEVDHTKTGRTNCNLRQSWNSLVRRLHVDDYDDDDDDD